MFQSNLFRRGFWAMGDQGIVSVGNFATQILLIQHLPKNQYGIFFLIAEQILFLNSLQAALVVYPLSLHGAKMESSAFRKFAACSLFMTVLLAIPLMLMMCGFAGWVSFKDANAVTTQVVQVGLLAAIATAMWQLQEMLRRAMIAQIRYSEVVWGDALSYLGQAAVLWVLVNGHREWILPILKWKLALPAIFVRSSDELTLPIVLIVMALTSAVAAGIQTMQIGMSRFSFIDFKNQLRDFWQHGRWALAACFVTLVTSSSFGWLLGYKHGFAAVAAFGVLGAVLKLSNPVMSSITGLITPVVSRAHERLGTTGAVRSAMKYAAVGAAMLAPYFLVLMIFPTWSLKVVTHNKSEYLTSAMVLSLRIFVINYALLYVSSIIGTILNGLGQSRLGFFAQVMNMGISIFIAFPLIWFFDVRGAVLGGFACTVGWAAANVWFLIRAIKHEPTELPKVGMIVAA